MMLAGQIFLGLHFYEAARRALKLEVQPFSAIQLRGSRGRRYYDIDATIVEFVYG